MNGWAARTRCPHSLAEVGSILQAPGARRHSFVKEAVVKGRHDFVIVVDGIELPIV